MNYLNAEDSAKWLAENKILLHPTEGVWGIGCNAKSSIAIDRIFDLKKRDKSKKFILLYWSDLIENLNFKPIDSKSALQEELLKKHKKLPVYKTISKTGPDHDPVFCIEVSFENYNFQKKN